MVFSSGLLVAFGCALGGVSRFWLCGLTQSLGWTLVGTLFVNVMGCFLAGLLTNLTLNVWQAHQEQLHLVLVVGFLGGLTTFSAFSLDVLNLGRDFQIFAAMMHILLNVSLTLFGVFAGFLLGSGLSAQLIRI